MARTGDPARADGPTGAGDAGRDARTERVAGAGRADAVTQRPQHGRGVGEGGRRGRLAAYGVDQQRGGRGPRQVELPGGDRLGHQQRAEPPLPRADRHGAAGPPVGAADPARDDPRHRPA
ncbi:hypothetical protein QLR68_38280, partial [Micromonospora sp. DH15]|nr:hypothetical protein [Micromonospora sp. DH15]